MIKKLPKVYFCFRSPYSWIATRLLDEQLTSDEQSQLEFRPFWEPDNITMSALKARGGDFLYRQMSRERHLYILQDIKRITKSLGWQHVWPIDENPWWELPNLVYLAANEIGCSDKVRTAIFHARWIDGVNIHDVDSLKNILESCGVDHTIVDKVQHDKNIREQAVLAALDMYHDGVFGIPFFIVKNHKFWGVDRLNAFLSQVKKQSYQLINKEDISLAQAEMEV